MKRHFPSRNHLGHRCGMTGKRRFNNHAHAMLRAAEILGGPAPRADAFRAYHCDFCGGWHLTSKPARDPSHPALRTSDFGLRTS